MPRQQRNPAQVSFLDNYGKTAPAVPAIRDAVWQWRDGGYQGATATSRLLLQHWFHSDHKLPNGRLFRYHRAQQEALESLIYVFEVARARNLTDLYQRFIPAELAAQIRLPAVDPFARYGVKMATGSGKTKVMALAVAWQYFNAVVEGDPDYATTFLVVAPNVIVFERLRADFAGGRIFRADPMVPRELQLYWDVQCYMRGEAERASSTGALYLTNIQQLYNTPAPADDEPAAMTAVLGRKPPAPGEERDNFRDRLAARDGRLLVLNDEAHHTHDPESEWNRTLRAIDAAHPGGCAAQLDFSATPRYTSGALFAWTISDYTLKQAILDRIVKRPVKGLTDIGEVPSNVARVRYEPFITAGIERWREYREQLLPLGKKPLLFVMLNGTDEADDIGDYLRVKYPAEFGGDRTLVIHIDRQGEVSKKDLDVARRAAREVDRDESPVSAIVSVLMLREGWDVQNVTVVVGLRPYTAKANILPEQTIGRGLRLMFRDLGGAYTERVDIIGNPGFIKFVEQLEQEEGVQLDTWQVGKDKLVITTIEPLAERAAYDIRLPVLSPILARTTSLAAEIEAIDVMKLACPPLPRKPDSKEAQTFRYQGMDILTLEQLFERNYTIPTPQTAQEIISYYAQVIAQELKLPSQFALLAPKVRDFLRSKAFGAEVDLDTPAMLRALSQRLVQVVTLRVFIVALRDALVQPRQPVLEHAGRALGELAPFPWSQLAPVCRKTVFNKVPCDNQFEEEFARFLDRAADVARFGKLPMSFGFSIPYTDVVGNLRHYYPDFVAVDTAGVHYLIETKGREDRDVLNKDRAAQLWVESATALTDQQWAYVKVRQTEFQQLQPTDFAECVYLGQMQQSLVT
ncbi:MAG TPA: DEAD/DEAH box helicase family protein [Thermomicrobiales bacterium]|nr:DEAD/DEAH box helicase family protein [Thermomicrobiales bacterium]